MNKPLLEVKKLYKHFKIDRHRIDVLRGIDLEVKQGDCIAIVGASGVGKSTFLHIIGTLERPSMGTVLYEGEDVFKLAAQDLARFRNQTIGFIFQFHYLLSEFNALENVMLAALIAGWDASKAKEEATSILSNLGLADKLRQRIGELSGGERQRVAVARALILRPKLILADEPTGNLDEETAKKTQNLLFKLNQKGLTMIVATHNLKWASSFPLCYELKGGRLHRIS